MANGGARPHDRREPSCLEPAGRRGRADLDRRRLARASHPRLGLGRLDRRGRAGLHPRQRRRGGPPAGRRPRGRGRRHLDENGETEHRPRTPRATSAATAPRAPASSARSRPTAALQRPRARRRVQGQRPQSLLGGLRWAVEQGFDVINMSLSTTKRQFAALLHELADSAYFRRTRARRLRAQHAGRELPVALLLGDLGRKPRGARPADLLLQPVAAGRVLRARRGCRDRVARRRHNPLERKQLRHPAHGRHLRPHPRQAPRADALPAQERPLSDRRQRRQARAR